uniref:Uncharacterized protein n=1 Tax=Malurus cyaneus samueli TaxID=2593467 RepID=A0A8C5UCB4_9PASS
MAPLCPLSPGTACELCPPGWQLHRGRCYYFSRDTATWDDSRENCRARKSQLLLFEDETEMVRAEGKVPAGKRAGMERELRNTRNPSGRASPARGLGMSHKNR